MRQRKKRKVKAKKPAVSSAAPAPAPRANVREQVNTIELFSFAYHKLSKKSLFFVYHSLSLNAAKRVSLLFFIYKFTTSRSIDLYHQSIIKSILFIVQLVTEKHLFHQNCLRSHNDYHYHNHTVQYSSLFLFQKFS